MCRAYVEDVSGGAQRVPAGADLSDVLLQRRRDHRAASGLHDGAEEDEAGPSSSRYAAACTQL